VKLDRNIRRKLAEAEEPPTTIGEWQERAVKLDRNIRRKLAEAEEPPTTIGEWQERAVRLDRNQRQSRAEERVLEKNSAHSGGNVQPRGGGSYGGRGGQIT